MGSIVKNNYRTQGIIRNERLWKGSN